MNNQKAFEAFEDQSVHEYRVTIIDNRTLIQRLTNEISFAAHRTRQLWPELKKDPIGFGFQLGIMCKEKIQTLWLKPNKLIGGFSAASIVSLVLLLALREPSPRLPGQTESTEEVTEILSSFSAAMNQMSPGIGARSRGCVGMASGRGEGAKKAPKSARGGGGSGGLDKLMAQRGRTFEPSQIPAVLQPQPVRKNPALPVAGIDIDPTLWKAQIQLQYGDPRSITVNPSRGPGEGGNFGSGKGFGGGEGVGPGLGPGEMGNMGGGANTTGGGGTGGSGGNNPDDPDSVFRIPEVTQRARVLIKPEPQYTEEARRAQITGTVVLRVVFSRSGQVTNIHAVHSLPFGLTERAIAAARQIRFVPALKDNRPVSTCSWNTTSISIE